MKNKKSPVQRDYVPAHIRHHLSSQPQSGLGIPQYCNRHSISTWSFYQWRKRYQAKLNPDAPDPKLSFKEIGILDYNGCICDVRFPSGITVSVRRGVSRDELTTVFGILAA